MIKFNNLSDAIIYFEKYRNENSGTIHYTIPAKRAVVEFLNSNDYISAAKFAKAIGVNRISINHWRKQCEEGLYDSLDGATSISVRAKRGHISAVQHLLKRKNAATARYNEELANIEKQIALIEELEAQGYKISYDAVA